MTSCPCGSRKQIDACCGPLIAGEPALTAEALMRSRYTAFTLGNLGYIERTCTGQAALSFNRLELERSLPGTVWLGLDILESHGGQPSDSIGKVKFAVRYRQNGRIVTQVEMSDFVRVGGAWRYAKGEVSLESKLAPTVHIGRNDACPCGSGKKYKKCCGVGKS